MPQPEPLAFVLGGSGWVGSGAVRRAEFPGPDDPVRRAADWWRANASEGMVAFGSFPFDPASAAGGVLIIPERVTSVDGGLPQRPGERRAPTGTTVRAGSMSSETYLRAVERVRTAIAAGRLEKAVLARDVLLLPAGPIDRVGIVEALVEAHPDAAVFAVDGLVGASPETLLTVHGGRITARVLAGTAGPGQGATLLASAKDLREHELAVRSVTEALAPHVVDLEVSPQPFVAELPHLAHLATDVIGTVADGSDVLDLVAALHPTAAVAGTPTAEAMRWIRENEPIDRGRYAGPVGWVDASGDGEWAIALRCARFEADGTIRAFAGAGIMGDSDPELELAETELKLGPILEVFGVAPRS